MTTGSRESGANLSTRCSGTFAEDGSGGASRSSSDSGMCVHHVIMRRIATSPVIRQKSPSSSRMLPNHEYPIPQREPLIRIIRNRRIHRSVSKRGASRRRNYPSNMLIRLVPHFDPKGGDCAGCRASLDWLADAVIRPLGSTPPSSRPIGPSMLRAAAQARSACAVDRRLRS